MIMMIPNMAQVHRRKPGSVKNAMSVPKTVHKSPPSNEYSPSKDSTKAAVGDSLIISTREVVPKGIHDFL
jgi:hypothetical protein